MCRVFGCVSSEPVSVSHELLGAPNPLVRQAEHHDSGWGMATYQGPGCAEPTLIRIPEAAHAGPGFGAATRARGRIFNVHVRRASVGGLALDNTHPFVMGSYAFSHHGTIFDYPLLGATGALGETDSEHLFRLLMSRLDPADLVGSLRETVARVIEASAFSGLNFLLSDGHRLYAYRLGLFDLFWLWRPGQLAVSSERITEETWHAMGQDVLLTLDPGMPVTPHAERLLGDEGAGRARVRPLGEGSELSGEERGRFAAERALRIAGAGGR